jgi:hypothetical protein
MIVSVLVIFLRLMALKTTHPFPGMIASLPFQDLGLLNTPLLVALNTFPCLPGDEGRCRKRDKPHY